MTPTLSFYSTSWNCAPGQSAHASFDVPGALANWSYYADDISVAVPDWDDPTMAYFEDCATELGISDRLSIVRTPFDFASDSFAYGKTENAALQNCKGNVFVQQNLDERLGGDKQMLLDLGEHLNRTPFMDAYFVPVINLYGSLDKYLDAAAKWYVHKKGNALGDFRRGPVYFGVKPDGKPDYNVTSTDELIDPDGKLVRHYPLLRPANGQYLTMEDLKPYVKAGLPTVYHLGYLSLKDRLDRSLWWRDYWVRATGGDTNKHPTSIEELANRETKEHGLPHPLWPVVETNDIGTL
jgi:hypothetical protein